MKPQHQAFKSDPDNGVVGDCLRTCIASILDMDRDDVPHFADPIVHIEINEWLAPQGLYFVDLPFQSNTLHDLLKCFAHYNPDLHYLLCVKGANGTGHVVVCKNDKVVMDPDPKSTIVGSLDRWPDPEFIDGFWWISFIARRL